METTLTTNGSVDYRVTHSDDIIVSKMARIHLSTTLSFEEKWAPNRPRVFAMYRRLAPLFNESQRLLHCGLVSAIELEDVVLDLERKRGKSVHSEAIGQGV